MPAATTTPSEEQAKPTLMLLDGNSLAFRAFYALPAENFKTRGGLTTTVFSRWPSPASKGKAQPKSRARRNSR